MNSNQRAVLYCRSSKDRADVSIDVQRRQLAELAEQRGYVIAGQFTDVVESGKDEDRPGFQKLLEELYSRGRTWSIVLALDTSRIARRAHIAYWFEDRECRPRGVTVVFKNLPEGMEDPERSMLKAVMHGYDEWHSKNSKRKGLAGMRENVRNGFRAGGRPPLGFQLEHVATGAIRDGRPVLKSRLVPSEAAAAVAGYLRDRAAGVPRFIARKRNGLEAPQTTLISIERNALTYAGHTVWNMLRERGIGGSRYRPRTEWEIKRDTHQALITEAEAEAVLARSHRPERAVTRPEKNAYLLAGLLRAPAGKPWHGDEADFYRFGKGRRIQAKRVDQTVLSALVEDLSSERWVQALLDIMRARTGQRADARRAAALRRRLDEFDRRIRRMAELAADATIAGPMTRTIAELERERGETAIELVALERQAAERRVRATVRDQDVRHALQGLAAEVAAGGDGAGLRGVVMKMLERVELDPEDPAELVLHYRMNFTGVELASPQLREEYPGDFIERRVKLAA